MPTARTRSTNAQQPSARADAWISRGLETLQVEQVANGGLPFDVLIVGSGYGGAVAADRLAAYADVSADPCATGKLRIAVLERGREYLRGAFPRAMADLAGHVRFTTPAAGRARGRLEGLFDLRLGDDMSVLLANGVGGGSLINAGVMLFPADEVFTEPPWPAGIDVADLRRRAEKLRDQLGAATLDDSAKPQPQRRAAMRQLGALSDLPVTIALRDGERSCAKVALEQCIGCGDCATGCNHGAKVSLDLGLLRRAQQRGVRIYSGATVGALRRHRGGWQLDVRHTELALRRRMDRPLQLVAKRVVLAAGTLGSTEILMRSQGDGLQFSRRLGSRFSGNGDVLAALYDTTRPMNAAACETQRPSERAVGPTITGMLDWRADARADSRCIVQDMAVPGALRRVLEEAVTTADLFDRLPRRDTTVHRAADTGADPCAVDADKIARSSLVAIIARDAAAGVLRAIEPQPGSDLDGDLLLDAGLRIDWPQARDDPRIDACHERLSAALSQDKKGRLLPNPMWRLLPEAIEDLLGSARGGLFSVHPLGGCPIGANRASGVVDPLGRVFDGGGVDAGATHAGLVVLDGSIIPGSLGVNPALTIAVLADRAMTGLLGKAGWVLRRRPSLPQPTKATRPVFARDTDQPLPRAPTKIEVIERLTGPIRIDDVPLFAELSLVYRASDAGATAGKALDVLADAELSRLRLFPDADVPRERIHRLDPNDEKPRAHKYIDRPDADALFIAPVAAGTLRLLHREASAPLGREARALPAWFANRGLRDIAQEVGDHLAGRATGMPRIGERLAQLRALASRAGGVRRFDYALQLGTPTRFVAEALPPALSRWSGRAGLRIAGHKRLSYERRSSPWAQLMRMTVTEFGGLPIGAPDRLEVSLSYFARMRTPLLRVLSQQDLPGVYADLGGFAMYLLRILIEVHLWSFRKPDRAPPRPPDAARLPSALPGLPPPQVHCLDPGDGSGAKVLLTVYPQPGAQRPPVLLIHGYSAGGTTFAHPALPCSLAAYLWRHGAEPWVVDLRSSCGMPNAAQPWDFEDMAEHDIPAAVERVCEQSGHQRIDIVSHCMGSAMLAMALLGPSGVSQRTLPRMRRWVMSQVTPATLFSPANMLRAYLLNYALNLLPGLKYPIGGEAGPPGVGADAFDRLLASLPYLGEGRDSEFDVENPPPWRFWQRTPWLRTRHRLDALFGRVFDSRRVDPQTLAHLDELFGEISLGTVAQTIHMARNGFVGNRNGAGNAYRDNLPRLAGLSMMSLHARDNGLADWEGAAAWRQQVAEYGLSSEIWLVERCGHQDMLIGVDPLPVFGRIDTFLRET